MIKKGDLQKKVFSAIFREIHGRRWLSFYTRRTEAKLFTVLICSNFFWAEIKSHQKGFHVMKKIYLKGSIHRRSLVIRKLAKQKQSCSCSSPRKVEIQSLSKFYLVNEFHSKYGREISRQIKSSSANSETSGDDHKESYISLLRREFSESTDLGWPFHTKISSRNQQVLNLCDRSSIDTCGPAESGPKKAGNCHGSGWFDPIESPKSRPGWPLLLIPVPPDSDNSSGEFEDPKDEKPENQSELDLLLSTAISSGCEIFGYEQLSSATSQFSSESLIGEGGCSSVYKGCISGGKTVAIKVIKPYKEALVDFSLEVNIVSSIKHKNIVPLLGICLENGLLISVHDYFPKGSLEDYLHGDKCGSVMPWKVRFNVAIAIGEALNYLHNHCSTPIIHRDVKSSNILLTNDLQPKLSDFGLAIWGSGDSVHSNVAGTLGYVAPEYFMYGRISDKVDVYAFGVLLLELLTGRRPISTTFPNQSLVKWAQRLLEREDYDALVDPKLKVDFDIAQMQSVALAARLCISRSPRARPKVSQILDLLKDYKDLDEPLESGHEDDDDESVFEPGLTDQPSSVILYDNDDDDSNNKSLSSEEKTGRFKFKDFLSGSV